jgi:hypothetical protein
MSAASFTPRRASRMLVPRAFTAVDIPVVVDKPFH